MMIMQKKEESIFMACFFSHHLIMKKMALRFNCWGHGGPGQTICRSWSITLTDELRNESWARFYIFLYILPFSKYYDYYHLLSYGLSWIIHDLSAFLRTLTISWTVFSLVICFSWHASCMDISSIRFWLLLVCISWKQFEVDLGWTDDCRDSLSS